MPMTLSAIMMSAIVALPYEAATSSPEATESHLALPQNIAAAVPADVHMVLQLDDAAAVRAELADRPIAMWINSMAENSEFHAAWERLARKAGYESGELFDRCFGRRVTWVYRRADAQRDRDEWALIVHMNVEDSTELLRRLKPRALRSRSMFSIYELPEHHLLLARRGETMLVGPQTSPSLMLDVLSRHGGGTGIGPPLSEDDAYANLRALGQGHLTLFMRHKRPLGGHSAATLRIDGEHARLLHRARFESPPFARAVTRIDIDASPLQALEEHALIAAIEPMDIGMGPLESFIVATVGEGLLGHRMRENMGSRRIIVLGDVEGRQEKPPVDLLAPTFTIAFEIDNIDGLTADVDEQMLKFARGIAHRGGDRLTIEIPSIDSFAETDDRQVDLSSATRWFMGSLPIAQPMTLNWAMVRREESQFAVISSHPEALHNMRCSIEPANDSPRRVEQDRNLGRYQSAGTLNGVRISRHLESWAERHDLFLLDSQGANPEDRSVTDEFQQTLKLMAKLAGGIDRLQWRLSRPSTHDMHLDIRLTLTSPHSAREQ